MPPTHRPQTSSVAAFLRRAARPAKGAALALLLGAALATGSTGCRSTDAPRQDPGSQLLEPNTFMSAWSQRIDTGDYGAPDQVFLRDDLVLIYTDRNAVVALSATGGTTQWISTDVVGPLDRLWPPVLLEALNRLGTAVERFIAFPSNTSYILLTADGGDRLQETPLERGNRALTSPTFGYEGLAFAGLADNYGGRAAQIDPTREVNPILTPTLVRGVVIGRPVVFDDIFYVADETGAVTAITQDGRRAWPIERFETGRAVTAHLTADEGGLYVPSNDSVFYVLDRETGRVLWRHFAEVPLFRPAFPTQDFVYLPVEGRGVVALSKTEGATIGREPTWVAEGARDVLSHDDRNVYLLYRDGHIVAHDKRTGEEKFRTERNDFTMFARNRDGARIIAATTSGEIVAIDPVLTRGQVGRMVMLDTAE